MTVFSREYAIGMILLALCAVSAGGCSPSSNDTMLGGYVLSRTTADLNHSGADPRLPSPTSGPADCVPPGLRG